MIAKCSCGRVFESIPVTAIFQDSKDELAGHYWNCSCGSTIFVPTGKETPTPEQVKKAIRFGRDYSMGPQHLKDAWVKRKGGNDNGE